MLDILIIFVKLRHSRFLKNIFEISLSCTVSTVGEMHEPILSITRADLHSSQLPAVNNCHKELHFLCRSAKVQFILICLCLKWFLQNVMLMYFYIF